MSRQVEYGLELTSNSKAGPSFSLSRGDSCVQKTNVCARFCYGNGIRYQSAASKEKRQRNFRTCQYLLNAGGPSLLAENLVLLIDQARPADWIVARINQTKTSVPWTLRIHDVGDFYCVDYVNAWKIAVRHRPECRFWFYTRSFEPGDLFDALTSLAMEPNCQGWLSLDTHNYERGIVAYCQRPEAWGISLLQEHPSTLPPNMVPDVLKVVEEGRLINFPKHHAGRHVPVASNMLPSCPQVLGTYPLQNNPSLARPCQACAICLPR